MRLDVTKLTTLTNKWLNEKSAIEGVNIEVDAETIRKQELHDFLKFVSKNLDMEREEYLEGKKLYNLCEILPQIINHDKKARRIGWGQDEFIKLINGKQFEEDMFEDRLAVSSPYIAFFGVNVKSYVIKPYNFDLIDFIDCDWEIIE